MTNKFQVRNARLIRGLQYFEAVARHRSIKLAAEELGVSQSAVSHQMRDLTESLGEQLMVRSGRGIELTATGHRLAEKLGTVFAGLQSSLDGVIGGNRTTVRLAVCSSFGPGWVIPRLAGFFSAHPHIDLQLQLYAHDPEQTDQLADAFVTALPLKPGFTALHIADERLVAVRKREAASNNQDGRLVLITTELDVDKIGGDWVEYCSATGRKLADLQSGSWIKCSHYLLALEMARQGLGAALVPDFLAAREVESGVLEYVEQTPVFSKRRYHLCFKKSRAQEEELKALAQWMKSARSGEEPIRLVHSK